MIHSTPIFLAIRSCREDVGLRLLFNWSNWIKPSGWKAICGSQDQNFKRWIFGSVLVDNRMVRLRKHIPVIGLPDQKNAWIEYVWDLPPLKGLLLRKNVDDTHIAVRSQSKFIDPCASPLVTKWTPITAKYEYQFLWTNYNILFGLGHIFIYSNTKIWWFVLSPCLPLPGCGCIYFPRHLHLNASFLIAQLIQAIVLINMGIYRAKVWGFTSKHGGLRHQTQHTFWKKISSKMNKTKILFSFTNMRIWACKKAANYECVFHPRFPCKMEMG